MLVYVLLMMVALLLLRRRRRRRLLLRLLLLLLLRATLLRFGIGPVADRLSRTCSGASGILRPLPASLLLWRAGRRRGGRRALKSRECGIASLRCSDLIGLQTLACARHIHKWRRAHSLRITCTQV